jgi:phenylacetate-coenzyme A ligase PaaK-like adenylate-forming protein
MKEFLMTEPHFWQGTWLSDIELNKNVETLGASIALGHTTQFNLDEFYRCCGRFSNRLKTDNNLVNKLIQSLTATGEATVSGAQEVVTEVSDFLNEKTLRTKVSAEFGVDNPFRSERVSYQKPSFEAWFPLGFIVQILAANSPSLPVLSGFEGLLTGNINLLKLGSASGQFTGLLFEEFFKDPNASLWKNMLMIAKIPSSNKELLTKIMREADGIVAWGGEESLAEIRKLTPLRARLIEWGHKISFSYITNKKMTDAKALQGLVRDVFLFDQQACSSPQCVFVEDATFNELEVFSEALKIEFAKQTRANPPSILSDLEAAEISQVVLMTRTESALNQQMTAVLEDSQWRILIDSRPGLRASPLHRTLWVKSITREHILPVLRPLSQYLQTVGLACETPELFGLSQKFYQAGATRVRPLGGMLESYAGEPHDGVPALTRYMKKVSLEQTQDLETFATLDDLSENPLNFSTLAFKSPKRIMTKEDFQKLTPSSQDSDLFFKSGGSSGEPKISIFTYRDYHRQMRFAADGVVAAGLNPAQDRCMNLFFGGGLYGGFLSFFTILESLGAAQFPMSAHMDFDFVGEMILRYKVNTLLGMPSYLMQLLEANQKRFEQSQQIEKIFFGGEHFSELQRTKIQSQFGIKLIRSASYGSVDMGPIGYQCAHCPPGVHHLHSRLHFLEILSLKVDQPVAPGETGRMVFSTHGRQGQTLLRYDLGDLGRFVPGPCVCGRASVLFELMGRTGDIFRAGGCFLNYEKIQRILAESLAISKDFQIILEHNVKTSLGGDHLTLRYDQDSAVSEDQIREMVLKNDADLTELVLKEKSLSFQVQAVSSQALERSQSSGKLLRVVDKRKTSGNL